MEGVISQWGERFLLHAKKIHKARRDTIKKSMADARVEIKRIEKDIRKLRKELKDSGKGSNSKLEELKWWREHFVQYLRDIKFPKLIDSVKDCVKACGLDFEKLKKELAKKAGPHALQDILGLKPEKLSPKEYLHFVNLLSERIHNHDMKVLNDAIKSWEAKERKLKMTFPTQDRRDVRLFPVVYDEYEETKDQAYKFKEFLIRQEVAPSYAKRYYKEHRKELEKEYEQKYSKTISKSKHKKGIKAYLISVVSEKIMDNEIKIPRGKLRLPKDSPLYMRNDKLYGKVGILEKDGMLSKQLVYLREITMPTLKEALEKINKRYKIFPEKEFERDKKKIYNRLKRYPSKSRKKII